MFKADTSNEQVREANALNLLYLNPTPVFEKRLILGPRRIIWINAAADRTGLESPVNTPPPFWRLRRPQTPRFSHAFSVALVYVPTLKLGKVIAL